ncbi:hypothetical protein BaRGS_00002472 [Batillaria attramentaria]|uniref:Uncharacterized protein n=1 Tax=Batillaria attramentaria TaxID=370345 RepID=A0ABD0M397_9CAEN
MSTSLDLPYAVYADVFQRVRSTYDYLKLRATKTEPNCGGTTAVPGLTIIFVSLNVVPLALAKLSFNILPAHTPQCGVCSTQMQALQMAGTSCSTNLFTSVSVATVYCSFVFILRVFLRLWKPHFLYTAGE